MSRPRKTARDKYTFVDKPPKKVFVVDPLARARTSFIKGVNRAIELYKSKDATIEGTGQKIKHIWFKPNEDGFIYVTARYGLRSLFAENPVAQLKPNEVLGYLNDLIADCEAQALDDDLARISVRKKKGA